MYVVAKFSFFTFPVVCIFLIFCCTAMLERIEFYQSWDSFFLRVMDIETERAGTRTYLDSKELEALDRLDGKASR